MREMEPCALCGSLTAKSDGQPGVCSRCSYRQRERLTESLTEWQCKLYDMLAGGKMACVVVLRCGTHITGDLERADPGLRMVSPEIAPGYTIDTAPPPTCERFFDYPDVVMVTRRLT
jgi:hypothetical protein